VKPSKLSPKAEAWRGSGSLGTIGLEIVLSIAFGFFGGRWLDGKLGTEPWLSVIGFLFGIGAAVKAFMRASSEMRAAAEREEREQGNPSPRYDKPSDADEGARKRDGDDGDAGSGGA